MPVESIQSHVVTQRCNAVNFESNVCEEANVLHLEDIDAGDSEKSFLIRSEAVEYVSHCLSLFSEERIEGGCRRLAEAEKAVVQEMNLAARYFE